MDFIRICTICDWTGIDFNCKYSNLKGGVIVKYDELLNNAKNKEFAIPQVNLNEIDWIDPIIKAASNMESPIIIATSDNIVDLLGGYKFICQTIRNKIHSMQVNIPIKIHLDHSTSIENCKKAVDAGYDSVMFDGSKLDIVDNVKKTFEVATYAHKKGVAVEGEVGGVGGKEDGIEDTIKYASIDDCITLSKKANIDILAPALGSAHGEYKGQPNLNFKLMEQINNTLHQALALHGATGISDTDLKHAIRLGHAKINFNTEVKKAWTEALRTVLNNNPSLYEPQNIIQPCKQAIEDTVSNLIKKCNSENKI
ncbi:ketose-bisphosphate aldolase [Staphylococcus cohnii]|nr:ketose-bisphosphate aldolase [Staphylococcus cohnii]RIL86774.1 ketose-bisphosphate aldolase [Staphylococcus cohnii]